MTSPEATPTRHWPSGFASAVAVAQVANEVWAVIVLIALVPVLVGFREAVREMKRLI